MALNPRVRLVREVPRLGRSLRSPRHDFNIVQKPYGIYPFLIAPVMPGETMKNALVQALAVTPPMKNALIGGHHELFLFYVKHRDLDDRDLLTDMHLTGALAADYMDIDGDDDPAAYYKIAAAPTTGINWARRCLNRVTSEWFRNEDEETTAHLIESVPAAAMLRRNIFDSAMLHDATSPGVDLPEELPGDELMQGARAIPTGFESHYAHWQEMVGMGVTQASFEDYLGAFGVRTPPAAREELHRPELVRLIREFTTPTAITNPANGAPARGSIFKHSDRADKDRFFQEPGFLFGVTVWRPKLYLSGQRSNAAAIMDDAFSWLPATLSGEVYTSLKKLTADDNPLVAGSTADVWVDIKDLFMYGDQFINYDLTTTGRHLVPRPAADLDRRFISEAEADSLMADATQLHMTMEGVVQFNIATKLRDTSTVGNQGIDASEE